MPEGYCAVIEKNRIQVPAIFRLLQEKGEIPERDMYNTYNMGLGMILSVDAADADRTIEAVEGAGEKAYIIGETISSDTGVELC